MCWPASIARNRGCGDVMASSRKMGLPTVEVDKERVIAEGRRPTARRAAKGPPHPSSSARPRGPAHGLHRLDPGQGGTNARWKFGRVRFPRRNVQVPDPRGRRARGRKTVADLCQSLQNGPSRFVRLTSRNKAPYFLQIRIKFSPGGDRDRFVANLTGVVLNLPLREFPMRAASARTTRNAPPPSGGSDESSGFSDHGIEGRGEFFAPDMVYIESTALKRCQRKGDRPRGGFRLPWARCRASAWEGCRGGIPGSSDAVTEDPYEPFPESVAVRRGPFP